MSTGSDTIKLWRAPSGDNLSGILYDMLQLRRWLRKVRKDGGITSRGGLCKCTVIHTLSCQKRNVESTKICVE